MNITSLKSLDNTLYSMNELEQDKKYSENLETVLESITRANIVYISIIFLYVLINILIFYYIYRKRFSCPLNNI